MKRAVAWLLLGISCLLVKALYDITRYGPATASREPDPPEVDA